MNLIGRRVLPTLAVLALLMASLKLAEQAAGGSGAFVDAYRWVLGAAVLALLVLFVLIGRRLWSLRRDLGREAPGARLSRGVELQRGAAGRRRLWIRPAFHHCHGRQLV